MMTSRTLPPAPEGSELRRWTAEGTRHEPNYGNVVTFVEPNGRYQLSVELDGPVPGYLVRLWTLGADGRDTRVGQTVVTDRDRAIHVATEMAAAAEELAAVNNLGRGGPRLL